MRILYHHRIASKDGQFVHVEELIKAFRRAGHDVLIVGPNVVESARFGSEGGFIRRLKEYLPRFFYELLELSYGIIAYFRLRNAIREFSPDIIYERYNLFFPVGVWLSKRRGIPLLLEVNAPLFDERSKYDGITLKKIAAWSEQYAWRNAAATLPVTEVLAEKIRLVGVDAASTTVIHNGVDLANFSNLPNRQEARSKLGIGDEIVLGFVGFIRKWHNLGAVINALVEPELSDTSLVVVGDGPARANLELEAERCGVAGRVRFVGLVDRSDLPMHIKAFDVALQPHVVAYASPLKMFEYMAMSLAIVAPDTPNIREILTHDLNAMLVPENDLDALKRTLVDVAQSEPLRNRIGSAARERIDIGHFTWDNNARRVVAIGHGLIDAATENN